MAQTTRAPVCAIHSPVTAYHFDARRANGEMGMSDTYTREPHLLYPDTQSGYVPEGYAEMFGENGEI